MDELNFVPPFFIVTMPVDRDGNGPAEPQDTFTIIWEVWDSVNQVACTAGSYEEANLKAVALNRQFGYPPTLPGKAERET